jgi:3'-5' exoribonuclease
MFPEALMLHYLDDLDSKMEAMRAQLERDAGMEGAWTSYNASLGRPLLSSARFLQGENGPEAATAKAEAPAKTATETAGQTPENEILNLFPAGQSSEK